MCYIPSLCSLNITNGLVLKYCLSLNWIITIGCYLIFQIPDLPLQSLVHGVTRVNFPHWKFHHVIPHMFFFIDSLCLEDEFQTQQSPLLFSPSLLLQTLSLIFLELFLFSSFCFTPFFLIFWVATSLALCLPLLKHFFFFFPIFFC